MSLGTEVQYLVEVVAGINIKGSTVHSWAGIGLGKEKAAILASRIAKSTHARITWTETDVLIIDESAILVKTTILY